MIFDNASISPTFFAGKISELNGGGASSSQEATKVVVVKHSELMGMSTAATPSSIFLGEFAEREFPLEALLPFVTCGDAFSMALTSKEWCAKVFCSRIWDTYFDIILTKAHEDFAKFLTPFVQGPKERPNPFVNFAKHAVELRKELEKFTPIYKGATLSAVVPVPRLTKYMRETSSVAKRSIVFAEIVAARRRIRKFENLSRQLSESFSEAAEAVVTWEKEADILGTQGLVNLQDSLEVCSIVKDDLAPAATLFALATGMAARAEYLLSSLGELSKKSTVQ